MAIFDKINANGNLRDFRDAAAVRFNESQSLTDAQKATARGNVGAASQGDLSEITEVLDLDVDKNTYGKLTAAFIDVSQAVILHSNNTRTLYVACQADTAYTVKKVKSARFRVGYTSVLPAVNVAVSGIQADNDATSLTVTTGNSARYIVVYYYDALNDTLTENEIFTSIQITYGTELTAVDKVARLGIEDDVKSALLACFEHVAWTDDQSTNYYNALRNALYKDAYPRITVAYNPGSHVVYQGDSLDTLKPYLTVMHYASAGDSGTTLQPNDYTLSGSLTEGTQRINVTYQGIVASFTVEVQNPFLYRMETPKAFNGSAGVDTGLKLLSENRSYTIAFDLVDNRNYSVDSTNSMLFRCHDGNGRIYCQMYDGGQSGSGNRKVRHEFVAQPDPKATIMNDVVLPVSELAGRRVRGVLAWDSGTSKYLWKVSVNGTIITPTTNTNSWTYVQVNGTMTVGGMQENGAWMRCFYGTMNDFKVFDYAMTETEALAYLEEV